jgi:hypothetical protein
MIEGTDKPDLTITEIAARHKLSRQTVRRLFENEPGVIVIARPTTMHKRRHRTMRIPYPVYMRVLKRLTRT